MFYAYGAQVAFIMKHWYLWQVPVPRASSRAHGLMPQGSDGRSSMIVSILPQWPDRSRFQGQYQQESKRDKQGTRGAQGFTTYDLYGTKAICGSASENTRMGSMSRK